MTDALIHPTAIISPQAQLGEGVQIGPNAIIEAGVRVGDRTKIGPMVHVQGATTIGPDNVIYTGATLGFPPQYLGFSGAPTRLEIGARNVIREYASIHRGLTEDSATTLGDDNFIMGFSHIAHDCHIGNRAIIANGALLAGHVTVGDRAFISRNVAIHQFCRIGRLAMIGGLARISNDVPPFMIAEGNPAKIRGINVVGLRRADFPAHVRMELKRLLREIYLSGKTVSKAVASISPTDHSEAGRELIEFYRASKRGMTAFSLTGRAEPADSAEASEEHQ
jgi:UDP-N-acetylglucosamine acyltransferase